ncbi:MAG: hypothetical protein WAT43_17830 [Chitinophagales bacterium]
MAIFDKIFIEDYFDGKKQDIIGAIYKVEAYVLVNPNLVEELTDRFKVNSPVLIKSKIETKIIEAFKEGRRGDRPYEIGRYIIPFEGEAEMFNAVINHSQPLAGQIKGKTIEFDIDSDGLMSNSQELRKNVAKIAQNVIDEIERRLLRISEAVEIFNNELPAYISNVIGERNAEIEAKKKNEDDINPYKKG